MNALRPTKCLICSFSRTVAAQQYPIASRAFSATIPKPAGANDIPKVDTTTSVRKPRVAYPDASSYKPYTPKQMAKLRERYSDAQIAAIKAGEKAITAEDLAKQSSMRNDPTRLKYLDDLSQIDPVVDKAIREPYSNSDPKMELKELEDFAVDVGKWHYANSENKDLDGMDYIKYVDSLRLTKNAPDASEWNQRSYLAPEVFEEGEDMDKDAVRERDLARYQKKANQKVKKEAAGDPDDELDPETFRLCQELDMTVSEIRKISVKPLVKRSVVNQTRLGKIRKTSILAVAGNGNGMLGIGEGKSEEYASAARQAKHRAIRNMQPIMRYENRTIFGDVKGKVGAVELELYHRPPGFGVRCSSLIFEMAKVAGITDLSARVHRARNPMNTVKAAFEALRSQKDPQEVARGRGKKFVDVRKVYYAQGQQGDKNTRTPTARNLLIHQQ